MTRHPANYGTENAPPNILFILCDNLAPQALPMYENPVVLAPNLERLAEEGTTFDSAYCAAPLCVPSRNSMMAGRLPSRIGAHDNASELPASMPTMVHHLRSRGYRTALSGKMHFIGPDQCHGFETRLTTDICSAGLEQCLSIWPENGVLGDGLGFARSWGGEAGAVRHAAPCERNLQMDFDEEVQYHAVRQIYDYARSDDPRPFFLTVSYVQPHGPFIADSRFWDLYTEEEIDAPRVPRPPDGERHPIEDALRRFSGFADDEVLTEAQIRRARHGYYAMISDIDAKIGELLAALARSGLDRSTIVVFASDHGDMMGERGLFFRRNFFEHSVRVPLVIADPRSTGAPSRIAEHVSLLDLLPTFVGFADDGARPIEHRVDGRDLGPLLAGGSLGTENRVIAELMCDGLDGPNIMIREDRWKYWFVYGHPPLLFDLEEDADETRSLAASADHRDVLAKFERLLESLYDIEALRATVLEAQRARMLVAHAHNQGRPPIWDYAVPSDPLARYMRPETGHWKEIEDRAFIWKPG